MAAVCEKTCEKSSRKLKENLREIHTIIRDRDKDMERYISLLHGTLTCYTV
jgi:hypothetical protein